MSPRPLVILVLLTASAHAGPKLGELVMAGHDAGEIMYADHCSNGANADQAGFDQFIAAMRADPKSRLARTLAEARARFVKDPTFAEVVLGDWVQTFHDRDGCADSTSSYSAFVFVNSKMSNIDHVATKYLITVDDDVASERRDLKLRSVVPFVVR